MAVFYVCTTFDEYNASTGFFVLKQDCIQWDEDILGPYYGPKFNTKEECFDNSICSKTTKQNILDQTNNYCNINIDNVSLVSRTDNQIIVEITLPSFYVNTYIEYSLYDIDYNLIQDWTKLSTNSLNLNAVDTYTINIDNFNNTDCPDSICLSGWEAVYQPDNTAYFTYNNLNGTYTKIGLDINNRPIYKNINGGCWSLDNNNNYTYTPNLIDMCGGVIDQWHVTKSGGHNISNGCWAVGPGFSEITAQEDPDLPSADCPTEVTNFILLNFYSPQITKIGTIDSCGGSGSGSEYNEICILAFRLVKPCDNYGSI